MYLKYAGGHADDFAKFQLPNPPVSSEKASADISPKELQKKQAQLEKAKTDLEEAQQREISILRDLQIAKEKADELEARLDQSRKQGEQAASVLELDEAETRRRLIDSRLMAAGWNVAEGVQNTMQVTQEASRQGAAYANG